MARPRARRRGHDAVGSRVTGVQVGAVLAFLASRVLGQYELFLPPDPPVKATAGPAHPGRAQHRAAEHELDVDPHDFRLWVCLHEETHRLQFTAVPWLRDYVRPDDRVPARLRLDPRRSCERLRSAADAVADAVRGGDGGA